MASPTQLALLVVAAGFLPPLLYLLVIRNVERWGREPLGAMFRVFLYGAVISVLMAAGLESVFHTGFQREYDLEAGSFQLTLLLAVIVAPVVEEATKGLSVRSARRHIDELEDGILYGAAAGLGFSATENVFYEYVALTEDSGMSFLGVAVLRSITSTFLHATASGILGYGLARHYVERRGVIEVVPFYALAVLLHAAFNAIAILQFLGGFFLVLFVSFWGIRWTVKRIRELDETSVPTFQRA